MINKKNVLQTAQSLVRQYNLPLKICGVEEGTEEVTIYFTAKKRPQLRELAQELELQLNLPIKLERVKKSETGKIEGVDVLGKYPCCAPFLRKCPFGGKYRCGYGLGELVRQRVSAPAVDKRPVDAKTYLSAGRPQKKAKVKRRKMVRRLVIKGKS